MTNVVRCGIIKLEKETTHTKKEMEKMKNTKFEEMVTKFEEMVIDEIHTLERIMDMEAEEILRLENLIKEYSKDSEYESRIPGVKMAIEQIQIRRTNHLHQVYAFERSLSMYRLTK